MMEDLKKKLKSFGDVYGKVLIASSLCILIISCLTFLISIISPHKLKISFLDVGQGDAILIQTPSGRDMLIDGGQSERVLEKLSKPMGYFDHHLDVVVATHPDADHITGLIPVLQKYEVGYIVTPSVAGHTGVFSVLQESITNEHAIVHVGKAGDEIIFGDGVVAHILYPPKNFHGNEKDTNSGSVSILVTYGDESLLLTGDLPSTHEGDLIVGGLPHSVTIYKAGHHGSKYSSGEELLSYIRPEYVVISAGKNNKYGHPNEETLERLKIYAKEILSTIEKGTISFLLDGVNVETITDK